MEGSTYRSVYNSGHGAGAAYVAENYPTGKLPTRSVHGLAHKTWRIEDPTQIKSDFRPDLAAATAAAAGRPVSAPMFAAATGSSSTRRAGAPLIGTARPDPAATAAAPATDSADAAQSIALASSSSSRAAAASKTHHWRSSYSSAFDAWGSNAENKVHRAHLAETMRTNPGYYRLYDNPFEHSISSSAYIAPITRADLVDPRRVIAAGIALANEPRDYSDVASRAISTRVRRFVAPFTNETCVGTSVAYPGVLPGYTGHLPRAPFVCQADVVAADAGVAGAGLSSSSSSSSEAAGAGAGAALSRGREIVLGATKSASAVAQPVLIRTCLHALPGAKSRRPHNDLLLE